MKKAFSVFLLILAVYCLHAQSGEVLMTIDGKPITKGEFEYLFLKNNSASEITYDDVKDYLDLYVKFKLKVIEAESRKMDTAITFINELDGYRSQLAKPYLTDQEVDEFYLNEAYNRLKEEVEASHILIELEKGATPEDTLKAYNKAMDVTTRARNGEDFADLARNYSDDPSAQSNGGYLGFFKGFQMVYPFESGAYATSVGEISNPVKSAFGYHIIKVHNRRPSKGEVKVAHIMKMVNEEASETKKQNAKQMIINIHQQLLEGKSFEELAKKYSDDYASAENGGALNWFSTGQMVKPFENASFALEKAGDISDPVQTQFGWHVIKLLEKREIQPFEELKENIRSRLLRDPRGSKAHESFIKKLEKEYNITVHQENIDTFVHISHLYTYRDSMFKKVTRGMDKPVLTIKDKDYSQEHFADYLILNPRGEVPSEEARVKIKWERYYDKTIVEFEKSVLEDKYPDFRYLMQEYHDGILLFEISSNEVWNKASEDTLGLEKFYEKNKKNYRWDEPHFSGRVIFCENDSVGGVVKQLIKDGSSDKEIYDKVNKYGPYVDILNGTFTKGENEVVDYYLYNGEKYKSGRGFNYAFIDGESQDIGAIKELEFCKGAVTSDYQNFLEEMWVKQLKKKYKVKVNKKVLKTVASDR